MTKPYDSGLEPRMRHRRRCNSREVSLMCPAPSGIDEIETKASAHDFGTNRMTRRTVQRSAIKEDYARTFGVAAC